MRLRWAAAIAIAMMVGAGATQAGLWQIVSNGQQQAMLYTGGPTDAAQGVVIVHDWFGLTEQTQAAADHLADLGYRVAAVNLYDGEAVSNHADAWALMQALDAGAAAANIDAGIDFVSEGGRDVAIIGFSMGVPHAIDAARRNNVRVSAVAVWYGDTSLEEGEAAALQVPLLAIYGELDGNAGEQAALLEAEMSAAGGVVETLVYPGVGHAFAQPLFNEGANYDEEATATSWALTEDFLARRLGAD